MRPVLIAVAVCSVVVASAFAPVAAQQASRDYNEPHQSKAVEIYRTIIAFRRRPGTARCRRWPTTSPTSSGGVASRRTTSTCFRSRSDGEETAGLVVRYRGDGSSGKKPILLLAHMDVVDARREDWQRDPFTLVEENGYFFGRGASDDKFGVASLTGTFLRLKAEGFVPTRDLIIAFTGDEETGMLSARGLVSEHRALTDAEFALNDDGGGGQLDESGKPVAYFLQTAEKTYATFELTVTNPGGHSSTPRTDNAINELASLLKRLEAHRFPVQVTDTTRGYLRAMAKVTPGPVGEAMARLAANPADESAGEVLWRESEVVGITRTTCVPTMLRGGHAENALPQSATVTVNCRIFPGVETADVQATLERVAATPGLEVEMLGHGKGSPSSPLRDDVAAAVTAAVHARYPGIPVIPYMAPYGTDGREVRSAGIPTYGVMGLFMKDSDQFAHGLNERVPVPQLFGALEHWKVLLTHLAGRAAR